MPDWMTSAKKMRSKDRRRLTVPAEAAGRTISSEVAGDRQKRLHKKQMIAQSKAKKQAAGVKVQE